MRICRGLSLSVTCVYPGSASMCHSTHGCLRLGHPHRALRTRLAGRVECCYGVSALCMMVMDTSGELSPTAHCNRYSSSSCCFVTCTTEGCGHILRTERFRFRLLRAATVFVEFRVTGHSRSDWFTEIGLSSYRPG